MLTGSELTAFLTEGYVGPFDLPHGAIAPFVSPEFLASMIETYHAEMAEHGELSEKVSYNSHVYSRSLFHLVSEETLLSRVRSILGPDLLLWLTHMAPRPPGDNGQEWHIDATNYWIRGVHVSIAVTENTLENGCLHVIPRSHLCQARLSSASRANLLDRSNTAQVVELADGAAAWNAPHRAVPITLRSGQYFLMSGGLWHYVDRNRSGAVRNNVLARFARPDAICRDYGYDDCSIEPGGLRPCIVVSGQDRFGLNRIVAPPQSDLFRVPAAQ